MGFVVKTRVLSRDSYMTTRLVGLTSLYLSVVNSIDVPHISGSSQHMIGFDVPAQHFEGCCDHRTGFDQWNVSRMSTVGGSNESQISFPLP